MREKNCRCGGRHADPLDLTWGDDEDEDMDYAPTGGRMRPMTDDKPTPENVVIVVRALDLARLLAGVDTDRLRSLGEETHAGIRALAGFELLQREAHASSLEGVMLECWDNFVELAVEMPEFDGAWTFLQERPLQPLRPLPESRN